MLLGFYRLFTDFLPTFYRLFTELDSQALHKPVTLVKKDSMVDALPEQSWATDISKQYLELGDLKITLNLSDQHFTKFSIKDFFSKCDRKSPVSDGRAYIYWRNTFLYSVLSFICLLFSEIPQFKCLTCSP